MNRCVSSRKKWIFYKEWDLLTMDYFDNLDNWLLNKYKKNLKNKKKLYRFILLRLDW
jgi:hypothetical protein